MNSVRSNKASGCKVIRIRKFQFMAKTQPLFHVQWETLSIKIFDMKNVVSIHELVVHLFLDFSQCCNMSKISLVGAGHPFSSFEIGDLSSYQICEHSNLLLRLIKLLNRIANQNYYLHQT